MRLNKSVEPIIIGDGFNLLLARMVYFPEEDGENYPQLRKKIENMRTVGQPAAYALHVLKRNWINAHKN